ncbi:NUDIX domain-containing protein [Paenibacillus sp. BC26]|uniref:NUDIX domain-containing protein n=1 Tax=Paenibacillus sp. BC26 TaxID=1881032 RepID=UPI0008F08290|nr:NUDIX domain-containing protein [Paenibacillus sp. BC26]SFS74803.1 argininosuccinate lyase [Paenibacillus sp. BC26]
MPKGQDASGIIIIDEQNRVLLVRQTYGKKKWSIPGGMVDDGESAWAAAERELQEEAGISVRDMELSGVYYQPHKNRYIYTFKADHYVGTIRIDNNEIDQYGFFDLEALPRPISSFTIQRLTDAIQHSKTVFKEETIDRYEILY